MSKPVFCHSRTDYIATENYNEGSQTAPLDDFVMMPKTGNSVMRNSSEILFTNPENDPSEIGTI